MSNDGGIKWGSGGRRWLLYHCPEAAAAAAAAFEDGG